MSFAILRTHKHTSSHTIANATRHQLRKIKTLNADPSKLANNQDYFFDADGQKIKFGKGTGTDEIAGASVQDMLDAMHQKLDGVWSRKDSVKAIEFVLTTSPDAAVQSDPRAFARWKQANYEWLCSKFGTENVLSIHVQNDEKTKHISAMVLPIDTSKGKRKLNCKRWLGSPAQLRVLQDDYAAAMAPYALRRGLKGSRKTHIQVQKFAAALTKFNQSPELCSKEELLMIAQTAELDRKAMESGYKKACMRAEDLSSNNARLITTNKDLQDKLNTIADKSTAELNKVKRQLETTRTDADKLNNLLTQQTATAVARLIRANYTPAEVSKALKIPLDPNRKDFFKHLTDAGHPFSNAVAKVALALDVHAPKPAVQKEWLQITGTTLDTGFGY